MPQPIFTAMSIGDSQNLNQVESIAMVLDPIGPIWTLTEVVQYLVCMCQLDSLKRVTLVQSNRCGSWTVNFLQPKRTDDSHQEFPTFELDVDLMAAYKYEQGRLRLSYVSGKKFSGSAWDGWIDEELLRWWKAELKSLNREHGYRGQFKKKVKNLWGRVVAWNKRVRWLYGE